MKKILSCILLSTLIVSGSAFALFKQPLLVMDMSNAPRLPRNFRTTDDVVNGANTTGLKELHMIGSAQFSKMAFQKVLDRIDEKHLTIIDLRQEDHGFLNGNAISWYAPNDAMNAGKCEEDIETDQAALLNQVSKLDIVDVYDITSKKNGYVVKARAKQYVVHQVMSEHEFAKSAQQNYARIYVQDTYAPSDDQVDRFLKIVNELPKDKWVYFHCRAGEGRTTTFMTMFDIVHNAKQLSFEEILERQHALGGKDLEAPPKSPDKSARGNARLKFLEKFYEYAKNNNDNFATSWTTALSS